MSALTSHDVVNALLAVALVLVWQSRRAPSVTMLLVCALTWRMLPSTEGEAVTGVLLLIGGAAARRRIARREERQWSAVDVKPR
jgi:hypothetical protein